MKKELIENILELEGVNAKGYGLIAQAVMFDRDISIQAKAIYAYLASYTGAGRTIYPKRETILSDLKISKNAYYKHFKPLVENGYIKISKAKGYKNKNIYTICNNPEKIKSLAESNKNESLLIIDGINTHGYGFVPKLIMCDHRLSVKAKGLIAFFYSLAQAGSCTYPHRQTICTFLCISKDIYYTALNQLMDFGYITAKQRHSSSGRFTVNDYILNSNPETSKKDILENKPYPENCDNIKKRINTEFSPCPENEDIIKKPINTKFSPCLENEDIMHSHRVGKIETLPCLENCDNNNNTSNNSSIYISSSNLNLPYISYSNDEQMIKDMIYDLTRYTEYSEFGAKTDEDILFCKQYQKTVNALIEMLCVPDMHRYSKDCVKTQNLFIALNDCVNKDVDGYSLRDLIMETIFHYQYANSLYNIAKPFEYLKSLLWHNIKNFDL